MLFRQFLGSSLKKKNNQEEQQSITKSHVNEGFLTSEAMGDNPASSLEDSIEEKIEEAKDDLDEFTFIYKSDDPTEIAKEIGKFISFEISKDPITAAKELQIALAQDLYKQFPEITNKKNYKPGLFKRHKEHPLEIKQMVEVLFKYATTQIHEKDNNVNQITSFICKFKEYHTSCSRLTRQKTGFFDKRSKNSSTKLYSILEKHHGAIEALDVTLDREILSKNGKKIQDELEALYHVYASLEQIEIAYGYKETTELVEIKKVNGIIFTAKTEILYPTYHQEKLGEIFDDADIDQDLKEKIRIWQKQISDFLVPKVTRNENGTDSYSIESGSKVRELKQDIEKKVMRCQSKRMQQSIPGYLKKDANFIRLNKHDKIQYIMMREILQNFKDRLKIAEKKYYWILYAHVFNTDMKADSSIVQGKFNLLENTRNFYKRDLDQVSATSELDLLKNNSIHEAIDQLINDPQMKLTDIIYHLKKAISVNMSNNEYRALNSLKTNAAWKTIFDLDRNEIGDWALGLCDLSLRYVKGMQLNAADFTTTYQSTAIKQAKDKNTPILVRDENTSDIYIYGKLNEQDGWNLIRLNLTEDEIKYVNSLFPQDNVIGENDAKTDVVDVILREDVRFTNELVNILKKGYAQGKLEKYIHELAIEPLKMLEEIMKKFEIINFDPNPNLDLDLYPYLLSCALDNTMNSNAVINQVTKDKLFGDLGMLVNEIEKLEVFLGQFQTKEINENLAAPKVGKEAFLKKK